MPRKLFVPKENEAYDKSPVQVKVRIGVREKLKNVNNWQDKLRKFIDELIVESDQTTQID